MNASKPGGPMIQLQPRRLKYKHVKNTVYNVGQVVMWLLHQVDNCKFEVPRDSQTTFLN